MIIDQIISFKTAKLAKELNFDIPVRHSYGHKINPHIAYPNEDFSIPQNFNSPNTGRNWKDLISTPTQTILQKWLREEHNCIVEVIYQYGKLTKWKIVYYVTVDYLGKNMELPITSEPDFQSTTVYSKYEDALEIGLKNALLLIKFLFRMNSILFT